MLFSSNIFLFAFLPVVLAAYFIAPVKFRNFILFIASILFYSWGEPVYVFLMLFSAMFNYSMALDIHKAQRKGKTGKGTLVFTVIINLFILCFFKYYGFLMDIVNDVLHTDIKYTALALPIGISFYTFQALSYIFDVYRKNVTVQKSILKFSLYLSLFPQLIAGPIVKYKDVALQLDEREVTSEKFGLGTKRFILGLGKKVLLANNFGMIHAYVTSLTGDNITVLTYWLGIIAFTLQIYFDFSGYSDMAIGLGKMFGFDFMENFNYPYISKSVTEFWRRWHISLSTWFKEYVYIPLGGNRVKVSRHIMNLLIVWGLTGLWHGASWNFIVWGLYYGVLLIIEKYFLGKYIDKAPAFVRHIYAILIVMIGWVFFSSPDLMSALEYLKVLFFAGGKAVADMTTFHLLKTNMLLFAVGIMMSSHMPYNQFERLYKEHRYAGLVLLLAVFLLCVSYLIFSSYNPFLYFRF